MRAEFTPTAAAASSPSAKEMRAEKARETAQAFEAAFVAEMLSHAGFEKALASDSGVGGEAMTGFLVEALAEKIVERGGFGVADLIMRRLNNEKKDGD
jgi:Rod binding domain-containing protein